MLPNKPDFLTPTVLKKAPGSSAPAPAADPRPALSSGENRRIMKRPVCSFPGLMKILIPEDSFIPRTLAVRVANLTNMGALIEAQALPEDVRESLGNGTRYFELKIAHPDAQLVRGQVVWLEATDKMTSMGLRFQRAQPTLVQMLLHPDMTGTGNPDEVLPAPLLDPFPPKTAARRLLISGRAPEAEKVVVHGDGHEAEAHVIGGAFEIELVLRPDNLNHFTLRTTNAKVHKASRPVPLAIIHHSPVGAGAEQQAPLELEVTTNPAGKRVLSLGFRGTPAEGERILYRLAQLCPGADSMTVKTKITSDQTFDEDVMKVLRREAKKARDSATQTGRRDG